MNQQPGSRQQGRQTSVHDLQPRTFAQKALARAAGLESAEIGEVVDVRPDIVLSHDNTAAIREIWQQFGLDQVVIPEKLAITLDHAVPAPTTRHAQNHAEIRKFVQEQGIRHFFEVGRGICHQVLSEECLVLPGQMILGADSHTPHFGWLGAFGAGIGRSEVAALWATGELWLRVPESIRIVLEGELPSGVTTKDFALRIIGDWGADGGLYASVEFSGSGVEAMTIDSRMALANMMAEFGAKSSYIPPDDKNTGLSEFGPGTESSERNRGQRDRRPSAGHCSFATLPRRRRRLQRHVPLQCRRPGADSVLPAHGRQRGPTFRGGGNTRAAGIYWNMHKRAS